MLTLKRQVGQTIWIGEEITVKVLALSRIIAEIQIDAPSTISIDGKIPSRAPTKERTTLRVRRSAGESIKFGSDIHLNFNKVTPSVIYLGVGAPSNVKVCRGEIRERDYAAKQTKLTGGAAA